MVGISNRLGGVGSLGFNPSSFSFAAGFIRGPSFLRVPSSTTSYQFIFGGFPKIGDPSKVP